MNTAPPPPTRPSSGNVAAMDIAEAVRLQKNLEEAIDAYTSDALRAVEDPKAVARDLRDRIADLDGRLAEFFKGN